MSRTPRPTIAVIDDHTDTRSMLELLLQDDFTVLLFASPEDALDGLRGKSPDVLIIDIGMPNIDGEELWSSLKRQMPATRAVAFTGFAQRNKRTLAAGFDAVVQKPEIDSLVATVFQLAARGAAKKAS